MNSRGSECVGARKAGCALDAKLTGPQGARSPLPPCLGSVTLRSVSGTEGMAQGTAPLHYQRMELAVIS